MLRTLCVAVALAMTPAGASATTGSYQELPAAVAASYLPLPAGWDFIEEGDWNLIDYNATDLSLVMAARQPSHIWVRKEYRGSAASPARSVRRLEQVDCRSWRVRRVSVTYFALNNLEQVITYSDEVRPWEFPAPGTMGEVSLRVLCG